MIWWIIATLAAYFVKGLCGFANTLVFNSILSFGNNNVDISPVELVLSYPSSLIIAWKERKHIQWKTCAMLSGLVLLGIIPGALLLKTVNASAVKLFFGFVIILLGFEMLLRERSKKQSKANPALMIGIGILSGLLSGMFGIGALLGAYFGRTTDDPSSFKGSMCAVFFVESTCRILMYSFSGILTLAALTDALKLYPLMLLALGLGMLTAKKLDDRIARRVVIVMLIISGFALILNNL